MGHRERGEDSRDLPRTLVMHCPTPNGGTNPVGYPHYLPSR